MVATLRQHGRDVTPAADSFKPYALKATDLPLGTIVVHTYAEYAVLIGKWASGVLDTTVVVVGSPGVGKTQQAVAALKGEDFLHVKGDATKYGLYSKLFSQLDVPVILDDVDTLLSSKSVTGLLKQLLETTKVKTIQWTSNSTMKNEEELPSSFITKSRTLVLANDLTMVGKNFQAVLDRAMIIWFAPTAQEVHAYAGKWVKDKEVYDYVGERLPYAPSPSNRYYYHAMTQKAAGLDWKKNVNAFMLPEDSKAVLVRKIDKHYATAAERIAAWKQLTGCGKTDYWTHKQAADFRHGETSKRGKALSVAMKKANGAKRLRGARR